MEALNSTRNSRIDFLRGIAILYVLLYHATLLYPLEDSALARILSASLIKVGLNNGNYGVTMFFVISGFLITLLSLDRYGKLSNISFYSFYVYRFSRIYPCLVLVTTIIVLLSYTPIPGFKNSNTTLPLSLTVLSIFTFSHNVLIEKIGYFNYCLNVLWVVSVEGVFYLIFPIICVGLKRKAFWVIFLAIILGPVYRAMHDHIRTAVLYNYLACFDAIAIGCCAATLVKKKPVLYSAWLVVINCAAWLLLITIFLYEPILDNAIVGISLVALGTAVLLVCAMGTASRSATCLNPLTKAIAWCGEISYELYLSHMIILLLLRFLLADNILGEYTKLIWVSLFLILSILAATLMAKYFSNPMNKRLRVWFGVERVEWVKPGFESARKRG
jgi:peptidoglycan/LPS O-acetylase OafA/YrhL